MINNSTLTLTFFDTFDTSKQYKELNNTKNNKISVHNYFYLDILCRKIKYFHQFISFVSMVIQIISVIVSLAMKLIPKLESGFYYPVWNDKTQVLACTNLFRNINLICKNLGFQGDHILFNLFWRQIHKSSKYANFL